MTITAEIFEDSGAVTSGHGTLRQAVTNIGWKNNANDETNSYVFYPLQRPSSGSIYSYKKYNYLKISGTYPTGTRIRLLLSGSVIGSPPVGYQGTGKVKLWYKVTNTYAVPLNVYDATMTMMTPGTDVLLYPNFNTTGPEAATTRIAHLTANTTYYSAYLVTYLEVESGLDTEYGNIGQVQIKMLMDEYEDTDV